MTQPAATGAGDPTVTVRTTGEPLLGTRDRALAQLQADGVAPLLYAKDPTLWGPAATPEASVRLGWLDCVRTSWALVDRLGELRDAVRAEGLDHVVLAGMGGSSLAPEVITRTAGVDLTVLDTTDPQQVGAALADRLARTLVVVSSKSGSTVETDSHRRVYEQAFLDAGLSEREAARRFVVVTDPGSPLAGLAADAGYRDVVEADPNVGGRYSALTAFGLVPAALAGVDVGALLGSATAVDPLLATDADNPGLALGAALGGAGVAGHDKVVIADAGSGITGFGDWAEQLIAESTGKDGKGLLPVVVEGLDAPGFAETWDAHLVSLGGAAPAGTGTAVGGPLGAQLLVWEYATAVAGRLLGINPFDQPNVQESKDNTTAVLDDAGDGPLPEGEPLFTDGAVAVYADPQVVGRTRELAGVLRALLESVPDAGYLAVMAYLDRHADAAAARVRPALAARLTHPVTFGWGPRFLHSTGQYHKGGPPVGVFLQVTGAVQADIAIPGRPYTFGRLQLAQALGDLRALRDRNRPVCRVHLLDRAGGLRQLLEAART